MKISWENYPELDKRLIEVTAELSTRLTGNLLHTAVARTLTNEYEQALGKPITPDSVRNRLKRVQYDSLGSHPPVVLMPHFMVYEDVIKGVQPAPPKLVNGRTYQQYIDDIVLTGMTKTLVLSDLHIPTQHDKAIDFAVQRNITSQLVIINGDILDLHDVSTFVKRKDIPIYEELDGAVRFFEWISGQFPEAFIVLTRGNHENRLYNRVLPSIPAGLNFLANLDILDALARPFSNIISVNDWFVSVGDAVYAHSEAVSGVPGKPAQDTGAWFYSHADELGITPPRFVVQAHTHRVSAVYTYNQKCVESGCLCHSQDYSRSTRYKSPQGLGYVTALQYDGVTDLMNSREYAITPSEIMTLLGD